MHYVQLGRSGIEISAIGLGGMPMSIQGRPGESQSRETINASIDNGVNFIDTADVYCLDDSDIGHNERLIAASLRDRADRNQIHVATKGGLRRPRGSWTSDATPQHLREACEQSLGSLGVDQIFLYQLHAPDPSAPFATSIRTLGELQRQGKIRFIGLSNVSVEQIRQASDLVEVVSVQNRFSPYFREAVDDGVIAECEKRQITFLPYSPVGGGRLSRKIPQFTVLTRIAEAHQVSPWSVALAWVRAHGRMVVPIPGASKPSSAIDSARSADLVLSPDEIASIDDTEFSRA